MRPFLLSEYDIIIFPLSGVVVPSYTGEPVDTEKGIVRDSESGLSMLRMFADVAREMMKGLDNTNNISMRNTTDNKLYK